MRKALIVCSVASMLEQFNRRNINMLQSLGYQVHVAANFNEGSTISNELIEKFRDELDLSNVIQHNILFDRNPLRLTRLFSAYRDLKKLIDTEDYSIVHCHSPIGGALTRLANHKGKVIYTAHGFHFYKGAPLKNWLIYFPIEYLLAKRTDVLITINQEDYEFSKRFMKVKNLCYVPGVGISLEKYSKNVRITSERERYGFDKDNILLLSVGELNDNKNHQVIIEALALLRDSKVHYLICGQGQYCESLKNLASTLGVAEQVHLLGFQENILPYYAMSDIFVFPSKREGLSVALMEAMSFSLPIVCSNIRGNRDLIENNTGGYLVDKNDVYSYANAIKRLINNKTDRVSFGEFNRVKVEQFSDSNVDEKIMNIYRS